MKRALVLGAGGFIGDHLVTSLTALGYWVRGVDLVAPPFQQSRAQEFIIGDLRDAQFVKEILDTPFDEVYQLAANMGGAGFIFTGGNDAEIMHDSALINLHSIEACRKAGVRKVFFSSSACIYPEYNQRDLNKIRCSEDSAYPAAPDSAYGWEKLFSERLFLSYAGNFGMDVKVARFHNVFGENSTWKGGREKAPAAICRKVAEAPSGTEIEVWGDGMQTRSFLYISDCLQGVRKLMDSPYSGPFNIGSEEMVSIRDFVRLVIQISGKELGIRFVAGPQGVRGRTSDNSLVAEKLAWSPQYSLAEGMKRLYRWVEAQTITQGFRKNDFELQLTL